MTKSLIVSLLLTLPVVAYGQHAQQKTKNVTVSDTVAKKPVAAKTTPKLAAPKVAGQSSSLLTGNDSLAILIFRDLLEVANAWQQIHSGGQKVGSNPKDDSKPKETIFGIVSLRSPCDVKTYMHDSTNAIPNPGYNYNGKVDPSLPDNVQYDMMHIDSVVLKAKDNLLQRIVIYAEGQIYLAAIGKIPNEISDSKTVLSVHRDKRNEDVEIRLGDIITYRPMDDDSKKFKDTNAILTPDSLILNLIAQQ